VPIKSGGGYGMSKTREFKADKLTVKVYDSRKAMGEEAAKEAAAHIKALLSQKDEINMIFAAAPSQNEFIAALISDREIAWDRINAFHMDEYIGLDEDAPQGFGNFLRDRIFCKAGFKSVHYLQGNAPDPEQECERYSEMLRNRKIDVVCMGIGENGHIAFNDPHVAEFDDPSLVKVVELDQKCRMQQVNDGCFETIDQVPTHALTLTIPALMLGECLFCIVPARTKAQAVKSTVQGPIVEACPASILRTHDHAVLYLDQDSSSLL
jgi:glucosamine-6-phosphate deaminase